MVIIQQIILLIIFTFIIAYSPKITANNTLPDLGNETQTIISSKDETLIGKVWLHQLQHTGMISSDLILNTYLKNLGNYLVVNSNQKDLKKFNFFMVNHTEINAFAFMGGERWNFCRIDKFN